VHFIKNHPVLTAVVVAVTLLLILIVTALTGGTTPVEDAVGTVTATVEGGASAVTGGIGDWFLSLIGRSRLQQENAELKERIAQLEGQLALNGDLENENKRLREIVNYYGDHPEYELLTARVIARSSSFWFDTFLINAGRNQGIKKDMVVLSPQGLVGRVIDVGSTWAKVISIIDPNSAVSAMIERTRDVGIVRGTSDVETEGPRCGMYHLPYDNDLVPGDTVLTSGLGGVFPKGIVIGKVVEVSRSSTGTERIALIQSEVDFSQIEEVMVLLNTIDAVEVD
jgi:rod shape-determining protein MreC